jgi:predicted MPP superfamily phosphohydrolase
MKAKHLKEKKEWNKKKRKTRKIWKRIVFAILLLFMFFGLDVRLKVVTYTLEDEQITGNLRVAFIADLHSCNYGKNQEHLLKAIQEANPDIVLFGGDIFDEEISQDKAWELIENVAARYPCYFVTGNHEWRTKDVVNIKNTLKDYGVHVLEGDVFTFEKNGETIQICGVDDPNVGEEKFLSQLEKAKELASEDNITILLTHRPELIETYLEYGFDYILAGHAHGGQWRIPGILNGLFVPAQGLFPEYTGGIYEFSKSKMIVSRGLARESSFIPRFYNRPELVMINFQ